MPFLPYILRSLAWRAATDPRVHARAADAARRLKPKVQTAATALRDAARESPPHRGPARFVATLLDRKSD